MKTLSQISIILGSVCFVLGIYCFLHMPFVKVPTDRALTGIEEKYLAKDISPENFDNYKWLKNRILENDAHFTDQLNTVRKVSLAGFSTIGVFLIVNGVAIRRRLKSNA